MKWLPLVSKVSFGRGTASAVPSKAANYAALTAEEICGLHDICTFETVVDSLLSSHVGRGTMLLFRKFVLGFGDKPRPAYRALRNHRNSVL